MTKYPMENLALTPAEERELDELEASEAELKGRRYD